MSDEIFRFPKERVSQGDRFRCRKCRSYLFSFENLTSFHKKIEPVEQCSGWYLTCGDYGDDGVGRDLSWIRQPVDKSQWTEGKIYCPKCTSRIGAFNITRGIRCSCFAFVIPAVWIQKCKVDQIIAADTKPNIRVSRQPDNPGNRHGSNVRGDSSGAQPSQSGQTGSQTSQTGSQVHSSQSQTGFSCSFGLPELLLDSKPGSLGLQTGTRQSCSQPDDSQIDLKPSPIIIGVSSQVSASQSDSLCSLTELSGSELEIKPGPSGLQTGQDTCTCTCRSQPSQSSPGNDQPQLYSLEYQGGRQSPYHGYHVQTLGLSNVYKRSKRKLIRRYESEEKSCDEDSLEDNTRNVDRSVTEEEIQGQEISEESEQIPEHLICPVCLDLLYEPLFCPCDHVFCDTCLRLLNSKCRKSVPRCPLCRKSLHYVYPAVDLREEIRKTHPDLYRERHRVERRAPHRRLPLPSGRIKPRQKKSDRLQDVPLPHSILVFLVCVLAVCVLCLVILFVFCPPTSNRCITVIGYE